MNMNGTNDIYPHGWSPEFEAGLINRAGAVRIDNEPKRAESPLETAFGELHKQVTGLDEMVNALEMRLRAVMRPQTPVPIGSVGDGKEPATTSSPTVNECRVMHTRVANVSRRIFDLLDRLET